MPTASPSVCVHETFRAFFCAAATTTVTAPGMPMGKTVTAADAAPAPIVLFATTEIEWEVLFARPVIVHVVPEVVEHVLPPGLAVAVYEVTAEPLSAATSSHETTELLLATVAVTLFGAHGTVIGASTANNRFGVIASPTRDVSVADDL